MPTATISYLGGLRTEATHVRSGSTLITDAPVDNHGKGESFSPTDMVATATVSCMRTMMGITANKNDIDMGEVKGAVEMVMTAQPRSIGALKVEISFTGQSFSETEKTLLENAALSCPVSRSLHPNVMINVKFVYN